MSWGDGGTGTGGFEDLTFEITSAGNGATLASSFIIIRQSIYNNGIGWNGGSNAQPNSRVTTTWSWPGGEDAIFRDPINQYSSPPAQGPIPSGTQSTSVTNQIINNNDRWSVILPTGVSSATVRHGSPSFPLQNEWMSFRLATTLSCVNLPVELTTFTATVAEGNVLLNWKTASETESAGFEVQHKLADLEAATWQALSFVEGAGTTTREQFYTHEVKDLEPGRHLFRLKQVDFDGTAQYHKEVEATISVPDAYVLSEVYPNPFNPQASFRFAVAVEAPVTVTLHDVRGQQVRVLFNGTPAANEQQHVRIDGADLPSGTYFVRLQGINFTDSRKVTLLK